MANVPLGNVKIMTEQEIDQFLIVDTDDIELLRAQWKKYSRVRFRDLIDARMAEDVLNLDVTTS